MGFSELVSVAFFFPAMREIQGNSSNSDSVRRLTSGSQWKFNRLHAEFPKHRSREVVRLKQGPQPG